MNNNSNCKLMNFLELNDTDIVIWTSKVALFYKFSQKEYKLYQIINENNEKKNLYTFS